MARHSHARRTRPHLPEGTALVVLGATGDLAHRKLYPALGELARREQLPRRFALVGSSRTRMSHADFAARVRKAVAEVHPEAVQAFERLEPAFRYVEGTFDDADTFARMSEALDECDRDHGTAGNRVFYLSTVPALFEPAVAGLGEAGLARAPEGGSVRLVVEKPFGHDLASGKALNDFVHSVFAEEQVLRIDHYLGKETVQNILALRFANSVFEPVWNRRYVDHVQITVAEPLGVGHRGSFYEGAGALRDIVQNHGMQVLSLVAMEPPASFDGEAVRDEKVKVLEAVRPLDGPDLGTKVVRGQYGAGVVDEESVVGYREEDGVPEDSDTETYLAVRLEIDNWRWSGVPFYLRTGKRLPKRVTEVALQFRDVPYLALPQDAVDSSEPNVLVLRIQPDEGIHLEIGAKVPGAGYRVRTVGLGFRYAEEFASGPPEAYERLLLDAVTGDPTLFIREDEVETAWEIVQPILDGIEAGALPVRRYAAGTWGPHAADALLEPHCDAWRNV